MDALESPVGRLEQEPPVVAEEDLVPRLGVPRPAELDDLVDAGVRGVPDVDPERQREVPGPDLEGARAPVRDLRPAAALLQPERLAHPSLRQAHAGDDGDPVGGVGVVQDVAVPRRVVLELPRGREPRARGAGGDGDQRARLRAQDPVAVPRADGDLVHPLGAERPRLDGSGRPLLRAVLPRPEVGVDRVSVGVGPGRGERRRRPGREVRRAGGERGRGEVVEERPTVDVPPEPDVVSPRDPVVGLGEEPLDAVALRTRLERPVLLDEHGPVRADGPLAVEVRLVCAEGPPEEVPVDRRVVPVPPGPVVLDEGLVRGRLDDHVVPVDLVAPPAPARVDVVAVLEEDVGLDRRDVVARELPLGVVHVADEDAVAVPWGVVVVDVVVVDVRADVGRDDDGPAAPGEVAVVDLAVPGLVVDERAAQSLQARRRPHDPEPGDPRARPAEVEQGLLAPEAAPPPLVPRPAPDPAARRRPACSVGAPVRGDGHAGRDDDGEARLKRGRDEQVHVRLHEDDLARLRPLHDRLQFVRRRASRDRVVAPREDVAVPDEAPDRVSRGVQPLREGLRLRSRRQQDGEESEGQVRDDVAVQHLVRWGGGAAAPTCRSGSTGVGQRAPFR